MSITKSRRSNGIPPSAERPQPHAGYQATPTVRTSRGSVVIDGGRVADNLISLREWYALQGVRSYVNTEPSK